MVISDVPCQNAAYRHASNDDVRRAYHAAAVAAACLHWPEFAVPTRNPSACLACRDVSRNKFTKVEVTSAPFLTKLYGPDTRRNAHPDGHRVIMLFGHSCTYSSINPDFTYPLAWLHEVCHVPALHHVPPTIGRQRTPRDCVR